MPTATSSATTRGRRIDGSRPSCSRGCWLCSSRKGHSLGELSGIGVGSGPGSFTGLRVAMALAKGLAVALRRPLVAVPSLVAWLDADPAAELAIARAGARDAYVQARGPEGPAILDREALAGRVEGLSVVAAAELVEAFGLANARAPRGAVAIARASAARLADDPRGRRRAHRRADLPACAARRRHRGQRGGPMALTARVVVDPMRIEDVPAVHEIERLSFRTPWPSYAFEQELRGNRLARYLVARAGDAIVGFAGIWLMVDEAHITTFSVHPDWRRQGIGRHLLLNLIELSQAIGARRMTLEVRASNETAQALYRSFGFEVTGRRPRYYSDDGEDALVMTTPELTDAGIARILEIERERLAG